jgi:2-oxoglutarate ferredoxin oxidoreductase subunit gamma
MSSRHGIRICGFGGQGVVLAGFIIGQAATVHQGQNAVFTQDYGPEARGGSCKADVIVSDEPVNYPYLEDPTVLVALSQAAYEKYIGDVPAETLVIIDQDLVTPATGNGNSPPLLMTARRTAEELGRVAVANAVMLGFLAGATDIIFPEAMRESIMSSVPPGTEKLNTAAFERGLTYALEAVK